MMAETVQERTEGETVSAFKGDSRFVSEKQHNKTLIRIYQENIQTYREIKEREERDGLSPERRRWLNQQIEDLREKINQVKGDSTE